MLDNAFRGNRFVKAKRGQTTRPELSGPQIPGANYECEWAAEQCPRCSFRYRVTEAADKQCPVCRRSAGRLSGPYSLTRRELARSGAPGSEGRSQR